MVKKLIDSKVFNTRVTGSNISAREKWLGYLLGPCGAMLMNAILGGSFLNIYYTDVIGIGSLWKGMFLVMFPVIAKILDAITNFVMGWIIEKTRTKQGKARPYILLAAFLLPVSGILLYLVPSASQQIQAIWIMITYNLYFSISFTIYNMSHSLMVPLSTRDTVQRGGVAVFNQVASIMVTGIIAALLVPMLLLPMVGTSKTMWISAMSAISVLTMPLIFLEYYFTKERVTGELENHEEKRVPYVKTARAVFSDRLTILLLVFFLISSLANAIKVNTTIYFCNYVLGTYADGVTQTMINVIGGLPMGIGIFLVWPIAKKIGKRNITVIGIAIGTIGSAICWMFPTNMTIMLIGQFIKNLGSLPSAYVLMALFADILDHLEWKNGFRCDGLAMSIYSTITVVLSGLSLGILNFVISMTGYVKPYTATGQTLTSVLNQIAEAGQTPQLAMEALKPTMDGIYTIAVNQNAATNQAFVFLFVGLDVFVGLICGMLLFFVNVEKTIGFKQEVIQERIKGITRNSEVKTGQAEDVNDENAKKVTEKERSAQQKTQARQQKRLAAMSPEKRALYERRYKEKEAKLQACWELESKKNEAYYARMQASLQDEAQRAGR